MSEQIGNPVEYLLIIIAQYRDGNINHKERCRFRMYPGLGMMDDRCETCQQADEQLERPAPPEERTEPK